MFEWLRNILPHHSQGSSMERWSWNTVRVVTASVLHPQGVFNTPPLFLIIQWRWQGHLTCCELRNYSLEKFMLSHNSLCAKLHNQATDSDTVTVRETNIKYYFIFIFVIYKFWYNDNPQLILNKIDQKWKLKKLKSQNMVNGGLNSLWCHKGIYDRFMTVINPTLFAMWHSQKRLLVALHVYIYLTYTWIVAQLDRIACNY